VPALVGVMVPVLALAGGALGALTAMALHAFPAWWQGRLNPETPVALPRDWHKAARAGEDAERKATPLWWDWIGGRRDARRRRP
jgi:hypothetical protein